MAKTKKSSKGLYSCPGLIVFSGVALASFLFVNDSDWGKTDLISCARKEDRTVNCRHQQAQFSWQQPKITEFKLQSVSVEEKIRYDSEGKYASYSLYLSTDSGVIEANEYSDNREQANKEKHQFDLLLSGERDADLNIKYGIGIERFSILVISGFLSMPFLPFLFFGFTFFCYYCISLIYFLIKELFMS
jgi:hypothetical protein